MAYLPAAPMPFAHESYLGRPSCPRCGEVTIAAEATTVSDTGQAHHHWRCDACGHAFETMVDTARRR